MAQISGTSATPVRAVDGQVNVSLPGTVQAAVGIGQPFAVPGDTSGRDIFWDLLISGTAPATLVVNLEGSMDSAFTNPIQLDTYALLVSMGQFVTSAQVPFMRLNIATLTGGDATTRILGRIYLAKRGSGL